MTSTADILIIGGGIMGASIAYHLAQRGGNRVMLLERQALCTGTTGHSGAIVRQHYSNDFTIRMAKECLYIFQHFNELIGGESGFVTTGMLVTANEAGEAALRANVSLQQDQGVNTRLVSLEEISEVATGFVTADATLACYEEDAGVADPMSTTHSFARRARELGAVIHEESTVTRILTQGERVTGIETTQGSFSAPIVILAANVWSVDLARKIGIELPITATRHPMVALRRPDDAGGRHGIHAVCLDTIHNIYLRPDVGGITLVGSAENVLTASNPDDYAQGLTEEEIVYFRTQSRQCFPALARAKARGGWAGIYDDTADYHPILGSLAAYEGLYCAAGFSGHGFKLSPIVGAWMAQYVLTGAKPTDMEPFAFERFEQGKEIRPRYTSGVLG
ncbi:MAG TPA: FAD-binding oxidoreductase [Ktedonosporobacter sp.]|nr:FAD-binding oxidoreductase [Ktedonosporobacter sp.]